MTKVGASIPRRGWATAGIVAALALFPLRSPSQNSARLTVRSSGGAVQLSLSAPSGSSWSIQYASSLVSPSWTPFTNLTLTGGVASFNDDSSLMLTSRFYRAMALQSQPPTNVLVTNMVWMAPATFIMGSPDNELDRQPDETQHSVTLTQGFFIGKYLVTQRDYTAVVSNNPSWFNGVQGGTDYGIDLNRPVESVYWFAAVNYCALLTQREQQAGRLPTNWVCRLPTEAEWEYACRAGTSTRFSYGDDPNYAALPGYAWFSGNSTNLSHEVGLKLPSPAGLYDVHGNVYEWCADYYGPYPTGPVTDPQGPSAGSARVFRGGSWQYGGAACRSAGRYSSDPTSKFSFLGFRVVVAPM